MTLRVLVADDQELIRTGYPTILSAQPDIDVVGEVGDGRAAVRLAHELRPDVVVMDVRMPVLDGIAATREIAGPGVDIPVKVLVVTTFELDEYGCAPAPAPTMFSALSPRARSKCCG